MNMRAGKYGMALSVFRRLMIKPTALMTMNSPARISPQRIFFSSRNACRTSASGRDGRLGATADVGASTELGVGTIAASLDFSVHPVRSIFALAKGDTGSVAA